jgi:hypothetical protein
VVDRDEIVAGLGDKRHLRQRVARQSLKNCAFEWFSSLFGPPVAHFLNNASME